ncbi:MAG TPA: MBL fold metallo-hydrolase, partial [Kofleriaceae bacterium]|nr:MBL fold metallo-hydrolase [Kofleriaceae bacterium]
MCSIWLDDRAARAHPRLTSYSSLAIGALLTACAPQFQRVGPVPATAAAPVTPPITPPITPPVTIDRIELRWSNVYLVRKADAAVLIDAGSPSDRDDLATALARRGVALPQIKAVVVTHAHADHAGCARWLQTQGAQVVLGAGDAAVAARGTNDPLHATNLLGALLAPIFMFPFDPFTPDVAVDHEIGLGDRGFPELHVLPVPGHTAGSIAAVLGTEVFAGDLVKGGLVLGPETPSEHIYQTDRLADHRALAALLDRGVTRLYPGHSGPLDGAETRAWLAGADPNTGRNAVSIEADVRGELPRHGSAGDLGVTAGGRVRALFGRGGLGAGFALGADARAGYLDGGVYEADAHPLGLALRAGDGGGVMATAGAGLGGTRGNLASHAIVELSGELPAGPLGLVARGSLGWALGGPAYPSDAHGAADEITALIGVRLGRDRAWGDYR